MEKPRYNGAMWIAYDRRELRRLYPRTSNETIGRILHRTAQAIKKQASRMGLRKKKSRK